VTYETPEGKGHLIEDKRFYEALRRDKEMNCRKYGDGRHHKGRALGTISPVDSRYEMDIKACQAVLSFYATTIKALVKKLGVKPLSQREGLLQVGPGSDR